MIRRLVSRLRAYWTLTKSLQTGLLLVTGLTGYMSARCPVTTWQTLLAVAGSLFLAVGGSTVLNMVYDRDIDTIMRRTCQRPLPTGRVAVWEALWLGLVLVGVGVGWAFVLSPIYGLVVFAGVGFDVLIYTIWLKRRTPYAIIIGGLAGGMPILAGRTLATGMIDPIGLLLSLSVLLWIPTHIMTFSIKYADDYRRAGVPTFPSVYGVHVTRLIITLSSLGAALAVMIAAIGLGVAWGYLRLLIILSIGLLGLSILSLKRPSDRLNFGLFKYASLYMLSSMLLIAIASL